MLKANTGICLLCPAAKGLQPIAGINNKNHRYALKHEFGEIDYSVNIGLCPYHKTIYSFGNKPAKIARETSKIRTAEEKSLLNEYYTYHINSCDWICENCDQDIPHFSAELQYAAQCHILPKKIFRSVEGVFANHWLGGAFYSECNCHGIYDSSWARASRMKVIDIVKERFLTFRHLIAPSEVRLLPDFFLKLM